MSTNTRPDHLFEAGIRSLGSALDACSNHDDLLAEAARYLDQATHLSKDNLGNYDAVYSQLCASARAACVGETQYDRCIDDYFSASPVIAALAKAELDCSGDLANVDMDSFWNSFGQFAPQNIFATQKGLVAEEFQDKHWPAFEKALESTLADPGLERIWSGCIATLLYHKIGADQPEKAIRCIEAMQRTMEIDQGQPISSTVFGEHAPLFLQAISAIRIDMSMFPTRIFWLKLLAMYHAYHLQSSFNALTQLYESNPDQYHYFKDAILTIERALEWTRGITSLSRLRFELLVARGLVLHKNFGIHRWTDDLETSAASFREALASKLATAQELSSCKEQLANVLDDLATSLPGSSSSYPEFYLKSHRIWREVVELTSPDKAALMARRLLELGKAAERLYDTDAGNLAHLVEASNCLKRGSQIATDSTLLAQILFIHARVLAERTDHPEFTERLLVGFAAFRVVKQNPDLLKIPLCSSGCSAHVERSCEDIRDNSMRRDPRSNIQQLHDTIEILKLLISADVEERLTSSSLYQLSSAYELLYRMQARLGEPIKHCMSTLQTALRTAESALKSERRRFQTQTCHALIASIYDELSLLADQDSASQHEYIDLAINHYRLAINRIGNYIKLTNVLERRYLMRGRRQDLDECVSRFMVQNGGHNTPRHEFYMSSQLVRMCLDYNVRDKLLPAYKLVFEALRRLSHLSNTSVARYKALSSASASYACDAAASALSNKDAITAVELLEQGRGCFFAEQLDIQTDTGYIRTLDPVLAELIDAKIIKIQKYTRESEGLIDTSTNPGHFEDFYGRRAILHDETPSSTRLSLAAYDLVEYLDRVRKLPGYQDPTEPKSFALLKQAALYCPVVYINISQFRCDAIVLSGSQESAVLVVPLPISHTAVSSLSLTMQKAVHSQGREVRDSEPDSTRHFVRSNTQSTPEQQIRNVLKQVRNTIVQPVLVALGLVKPTTQLTSNPAHLPHVCWCLTGPAATFLPLHAAGDYSLGPEHRATSYIVSSYTSTVTSLARTMERDVNPHPSLLLISQPASPPNMPLPHVSQERDAIVIAMDQANTPITVLHDGAGRVADVTALLPKHSILHLACHGKQHKADPLESAVILHDGELKLREIISKKLPSAELVYLSACQTAAGDANTPEESLSLAAGFIFAGYRGAVATMWSINDKDGADVAKSFYEHLLKLDGPPATNAALALHFSIQDLIIANPDISLIRWIPFMYFGVTRGPE